ncbi:MAG TPA: GNAT family N-acetyltransferase [Eubacteriales bacterium]|nr:GNAT family N-acetyltransferase [Eubacteriales bacterium]
MITYRKLKKDELNRALFARFIRTQNVTKCWRKIDGEWTIQNAAFVDDWTEQEYSILISSLTHTVETGGFVAGAFDNGDLKGFVSVESRFFGGGNQYLDLSSIHVSQDMRGKGVGKELFRLAKDWAKSRGARKLYISAHSAVESQAFYRAMGCAEAAEYDREHVEKEPCDCQLECRL